MTERESYIEGSRWALPDSWVRKAVLDTRDLVSVELVEESRVTSGLRATIFFTLRGDETDIERFLAMVEESVDARNHNQ